jgi:hypothetical protein
VNLHDGKRQKERIIRGRRRDASLVLSAIEYWENMTSQRKSYSLVSVMCSRARRSYSASMTLQIGFVERTSRQQGAAGGVEELWPIGQNARRVGCERILGAPNFV